MLTAPRAPLSEGPELRPLEPGDRPRVTAVADTWWGRSLPGPLPHPFFREFRTTSFVVERDGVEPWSNDGRT